MKEVGRSFDSSTIIKNSSIFIGFVENALYWNNSEITLIHQLALTFQGMIMILEEVTINNFCSCKHLKIQLTDFNPIIGYNNCGKSNILRAINWLLKKSTLSNSLFFDSNQPVTVEGRISSVNINLLPINQQNQIARYISNGGLTFRRRQDSPTSTAAQIKIDVKDPVTGQWTANPTGLDNAIAELFPDPLYIQAMDDSADDISKFAAKNTLGQLLKLIFESIKNNNQAAHQSLLNSLGNLNTLLNGPTRLPEFAQFESQASHEVSNFYPGINIHLDINPPDFDEHLKNSTLSLSDTTGVKRPFSSFGHGSQRTTQMALIKMLATTSTTRSQPSQIKVLLIDEPETFLHPQAIESLRDALKVLSQSGFQVIITTHSPLMIDHQQVLNTLMVYKNNAGETSIRNKLSNAIQTLSNNPHQANIVFSIQNSTHLLFSEHVILVEGKTESMMIPDLYNIVKGSTLPSNKYCHVECQGSPSIYPMMKVLRAVGYFPKAIADLDYIFKIAPGVGLINRNDPAWIACFNWFAANSSQQTFFIGTDGFPTKKSLSGEQSVIKPEEAFEKMATQMQNEVSCLVNQLKSQNIWVWDKGAIEVSLGITKDHNSRIGFLNTLRSNNSINHATTPYDITNCINWL